MNRRQFIAASAGLVASTSLHGAPTTATAPATTKSSEIPDDVVWHDVRDWGLEGRAFDDTENYFDRLPGRAKEVVRPAVWGLSRNTSGMAVMFETDAPAIYARYALLNERLAMPHMPATGVSGLDLYGRGESRWHYVRTVSPAQQSISTLIQEGLDAGQRKYRLYLPLYNGVTSLEIGVQKGAAFEPLAPRKEKPILFYGTSITQGGCASRPGMSFTSILGRRLDRPMLNFGFSGNGRMELEVVRFLAELDPAVFVIDCAANTEAKQIAERAAPLVKLLRAAHQKTPILLLDERRWSNATLLPSFGERHREKYAALKQEYESLLADGVAKLHFRGGEDLIGDDGEATVDGSHPTDLGMMRYADALEGDLKTLLVNISKEEQS